MAVFLDRAVNKEDRDIQLADHLVVVIIEHLDAEDRFHKILAERVGECLCAQVFLCDAVSVHREARLGDLTLEFVQHSRGKVRLCQKSGSQQCDLSLILRRLG